MEKFVKVRRRHSEGTKVQIYCQGDEQSRKNDETTWCCRRTNSVCLCRDVDGALRQKLEARKEKEPEGVCVGNSDLETAGKLRTCKIKINVYFGI